MVGYQTVTRRLFSIAAQRYLPPYIPVLEENTQLQPVMHLSGGEILPDVQTALL